MENPDVPEVVAPEIPVATAAPETTKPAPAPESPPATTPVSAALDAAAISAQAIESERARVGEIRAWAKVVESVQKINLTDAVDAFVKNGKTLAEFKDHVITTTFKAASLTTPTDTTLAQGNTITRAEFEKLSPFNQSDFCKKGGKITD